MNFFQFAQSSKNKPAANSITPPSSSFIQFPTIAKEEMKSEIEKKVENTNASSNSETNNNSSLDQNSRSPFIFNPKKVTFANTEAINSIDKPIKINSILIPQSQSDVSLIPSDISPNLHLDEKNEELVLDEKIKNNDEDITCDNFEEQISRLENDFKLISSWSQKQMSTLQQLQEEINISSLKGNELFVHINTILKS